MSNRLLNWWNWRLITVTPGQPLALNHHVKTDKNDRAIKNYSKIAFLNLRLTGVKMKP